MAPRGRAWLLGMHAAVLGVGWVPAVFLVVGDAGVREAVLSMPPWLAGGLVAVGLVFVAPFTWPVLVAVALFEGNLVERVARGDERAAVTARAVLLVQAAAYVALGALAVFLARLADLDGPLAPVVLGGWLVPGLLAAGHAALARAVGPRRA